eukprot:scaffold187897_cov35-Tisochrysis_lutea.AAC.3
MHEEGCCGHVRGEREALKCTRGHHCWALLAAAPRKALDGRGGSTKGKRVKCKHWLKLNSLRSLQGNMLSTSRQQFHRLSSVTHPRAQLHKSGVEFEQSGQYCLGARLLGGPGA